MGRHADRTDLGAGFGATGVVAERARRASRRSRELTGGDGAMWCWNASVSYRPINMSFGAVRDGGTISRVGAPSFTDVPLGFPDVHAQHHPHRRRCTRPRLH